MTPVKPTIQNSVISWTWKTWVAADTMWAFIGVLLLEGTDIAKLLALVVLLFAYFLTVIAGALTVSLFGMWVMKKAGKK